MAIDMRYNLTHIGDIFIDLVKKTADSATLCSKLIFLAYDIKSLHCEKNQYSRKIGERISLLIKEGANDFTNDAKLSEDIAKLNSIEKVIAGYQDERSKLVCPFKVSETMFSKIPFAGCKS